MIAAIMRDSRKPLLREDIIAAVHAVNPRIPEDNIREELFRMTDMGTISLRTLKVYALTG